MALSDIMTQIATIQEDIEGIKVAYTYAPAKLGPLPCFANFIDKWDVRRVTMAEYRIWYIKMQLFVVKGILPKAEEQLRPFIERTMTAFNTNITLNSTVETSGIVHGDYGGMEYGKHDYLGISFDLEAVEFLAQTYS